MKKILPKLKVSGFDISRYGLKNAKQEVKKFLFLHNAKNKFPFKNKYQVQRLDIKGDDTLLKFIWKLKVGKLF